jgi:hypothetical protein
LLDILPYLNGFFAKLKPMDRWSRRVISTFLDPDTDLVKVAQNCAKVTQTVSETVGICVFLGFEKKPSFGLIQSKTSGNPYVAGVLLDAQAGDCTGNHQLLNF